ncbi:Nitrilase family, member 2 [Seminavis robusta]|uniref:Nitrilase family, member 2 n=1 Tax=Seminavis robusta TaxID=568900 RepID=A0A9N8EPH9_9STRA|nr:Nitrilase family, member 2 [Seminavis robusta]|eukprot:Sro1342_g264540.1 Nitrilase family, member 2 (303) ;mRNA; r:6795-7800
MSIEKPASCCILLPKSFVPSVNEVIIGRGKKVMDHSGNERFREMIQAEIAEYGATSSKTAKSAIIFRVLTQIKRGSPETGGFVKQDPQSERWYTIEDTCARTTTAQAFRDALSHTYRSSKQYKQKRRWKRKTNSFNDLEDALDTVPVATNMRPAGSLCSLPSSFHEWSQRHQAHGGNVERRLGNILDSAMHIMDDDLESYYPTEATSAVFPEDTMPLAIPSGFHNNGGDIPLLPPHDLTAFWEVLGQHAQETEDPFEPTPISPNLPTTKQSSISGKPLSPGLHAQAFMNNMSLKLALSCFST